PDFDFPSGLAHLRLFGVRYYVAYDACREKPDATEWKPCKDLGMKDQETQAAAAAGLPVVARSGRFTIYRVGSGDLVEVPEFKPVLVDHADWRVNSLTWYANPDWQRMPLVYASAKDKAARAAFAPSGPLPLTSLPREPPARPGGLAAPMSPT